MCFYVYGTFEFHKTVFTMVQCDHGGNCLQQDIAFPLSKCYKCNQSTHVSCAQFGASLEGNAQMWCRLGAGCSVSNVACARPELDDDIAESEAGQADGEESCSNNLKDYGSINNDDDSSENYETDNDDNRIKGSDSEINNDDDDDDDCNEEKQTSSIDRWTTAA
jgi:hypothetical protein